MSDSSPLVSIILPVYNRQEFIAQAIDSVLNQTYNNWELLIADNASEEDMHSFLKPYIGLSQVKVIFNSVNLGLFGSLNKTIKTANGQYILILCSDDFLKPLCLETLVALQSQHQETRLILSSFDIVNLNGEPMLNGSDFYYDEFAKNTSLWFPKQLVPILLQYGSINGNITGMWFSKEVLEKIGGFRDDWTHAADWEWIYRVSRTYPVLISRTNIAIIRNHDKQLSVDNRVNLKSTIEVSEVVKMLLTDEYLSAIPQRKLWARHIMQYHLWLACKFLFKGYWGKAQIIIKAVNNSTGFWETLWQMIKWLPVRWQIHKSKSFPLPPS